MGITQFGKSANVRMPIVLIGSRCDLIDEFDESWSYIQTTGKNVDKDFQEMAKGIIQQ